tara:strand:- start:264821 stop:265999 length:1179 start_codon:yes stop_codon:yes gene_type:complete
MNDAEYSNQMEKLATIQPWMWRVFESEEAMEIVSPDAPLEGTFWAYADNAYFEICSASCSSDPAMRRNMGMKLSDRIARIPQTGIEGEGLVRLRLRNGVKLYDHFEALGFDPVGMFGQTTSAKLVLAFRSRLTGEMAGMLKSASLDHITVNLKCELDALQAVAGRVPAPRALLASGEYESGATPVTSVQSWCEGERLSGVPVAIKTDDTVARICRWLVKLVDHGSEQMSLRNLAQQQSSIVKAHPRLEDAEKKSLCMLLEAVRDARAFPTSRLHGDLRPENILLQDGSGEFIAVDWEFSRPRSLGLLDLLRYLLEGTYGNSQVRSFAGAVSPDAVRWIRNSGLPGADLPITEMVALQFAIHYTDRIGSFGRRSQRMRVLQALLQGECERLSL